MSDASPESFVLAITDDIPKFDIGPEIPKQTRNDVEALLVSYRPNKIKTTDIELSITVTDDKPIYHSPRRLPFTERDILDKLQDTRVFSTIDLRNGFFHVPVNKQSLTGYFRKFIPAYSVIAKPLSDLLRKDTPFNFDVKQKTSFDELKRLLCQKPVLGFLHPLVKDDVPLSTYHIDHLGPLATSHKNYKFILAVIDSFTKFVWLYPTKTTSTSEVIKKLDIQKTTFGNPRFLITDRGTTFTSDEFHAYCSEQNISLHHITTGLPRANVCGQVERINRTIISVLSKMSEDDPTKWFKHVPSLQEVLNSTFQRSINTTPFELLFGTQINNKTDLRIQQLIDEQLQLEFNENRNSYVKRQNRK
ncbi:retrovirus-related Pol polyprotein from transposon 297 [Trichonephila inaurata madagascariensis]|uniref:Retrovirus-related Pol polyprotein from transposon 297 n=1 Tax=Trichonephila inaurata madagascariensis TaxID=2747483 RepID=A0A8X6KI83_9ARAC|nr:retrovirus-related Pol polyprotein from transposon 297 [Trichonephila inaurata madagascariensis]